MSLSFFFFLFLYRSIYRRYPNLFFIIVIIQYRVMFLDIVIIKGAYRRIRLTMFLSLVSSLDINLNRREGIAHRIVSVKLSEFSYVLGCAVCVIVKFFCTFEAHQFFSGKRKPQRILLCQKVLRQLILIIGTFPRTSSNIPVAPCIGKFELWISYFPIISRLCNFHIILLLGPRLSRHVLR